MDNFTLFFCGLAVTLISGLGVIVYVMTPPSYEKPLKKPEPDIDLGSHPEKLGYISKQDEPDSLELHSVS